ncbi:MAG: 3-oxoacyl-ACP synthase III family protein [Egibacteraceae bacterium]
MATAHVVGTGSFLPGEAITNDDLLELVGPLPDEVLEGIQVKTRHWMVDPKTGEHRFANSEMAFNAAVTALDRAGIEAAEVELIVSSTASPEFLLPPMATLLQERLGIRSCAAVEIRSGCAGFVEALDIARLYLERGDYTNALVVGSESISPLLVPVFYGKAPDKIRMRDRMNPYNFGDGAGAVVLAADDRDGGIIGSAMGSIGGEKRPGMQIVGAGTHAPIHEQLKAKHLVVLDVDVVESGRFTPHLLVESLRAILKGSGAKADEIDVCIIPEGNAGYMVEEFEGADVDTADWLTIQPRVVENLALVGATGTAAVPLALDHAVTTGLVKQGHRVMLDALETSKWKYAGVVLDWTLPTWGDDPVPTGGREDRREHP